jgi:hypothetical protein
MKIDRVAMTGADDSIQPEDLLEINAAYPEVEWAILLSKNSVGFRRFPSFKWIERLKDASKGVPIRLSGHLCGSWVRDLLLAKPTVLNEQPGLLDMFQRVQLNFHAYDHEYDKDFLKVLPSDKQYIFQIDNVNDSVFKFALDSGLNAVPLFDVSGGAGIVPDKWPTPIDSVYCGYAGGLGPDSMTTQLELISKVATQTIWIDMERRIRSEDDETFLLGKVKICLDLVRKFMDNNK